MRLARILILATTLQLLGIQAGLASPGDRTAPQKALCEVVFLHSSPLIEEVSDLRHGGALDINFRIARENMFTPRKVFIGPNTSSSRPQKLALSQIHFMQNGISEKFSDGQNHVLSLARDLRDGEVNPERLPPIRVWQDVDGKIWTLDHRRLAAMILSGKIEATTVIWASTAEILKDSFKFKTLSDGDNMLLYVNPELSLIVNRPGSQNQSLSKQEISQHLTRLEVNARLAQRLLSKWDSLHIKDIVGNSSLPKFKKDSGLGSHRQTKSTEILSPESQQIAVSQILFSKTRILLQPDSEVFALAQKIRVSGPQTLKPLKVWQDAHQRIWTEDNESLAALKLAGYTGPLTIEILKGKSLKSAYSDSQSGGDSILLQISEAPVSLLVD
jgi:hypothetical protein